MKWVSISTGSVPWKMHLLDSEPFGAGALSSRVFAERHALLVLLELGL